MYTSDACTVLVESTYFVLCSHLSGCYFVYFCQCIPTKLLVKCVYDFTTYICVLVTVSL